MKKHFLPVFVFCLFSAAVQAIPGVSHFIDDFPGEYIFYEDFSFTRKSYIGFLTYSDGAFAARYFAPATETLPYKNIELLFSVDAKKDYVDMTGEQFVTPILEEDTEIINYIHDLIYEFSTRRKKAGEISPAVEADASKNPGVKFVKSTNFLESGFSKTERFDQFGGDVCIYYDYLAPIFNIKKIVSNSGEPLFVAVASGILKSSDDRSFSEFKITEPAKKLPVHKVKNRKPAKKIFEFENMKLTLDENWSNASQLQNILFYGDAAMIRTSAIAGDEMYLYLKTVLLSSSDSFLPWNKISIIEENNRLTVYSTSYSGKNDYRVFNSFVRSGGRDSGGEAMWLSLSVSVGDYEKNRVYFSNILKEWK